MTPIVTMPPIRVVPVVVTPAVTVPPTVPVSAVAITVVPPAAITGLLDEIGLIGLQRQDAIRERTRTRARPIRAKR